MSAGSLLLACDAAAATESTRIFLREVFRWQRRQARRRGLSKPLVGAVSFTQRFGSRLNLNLHHHTVLPDGVFVHDGESVRFDKLQRPSASDLKRILERIARITLEMLRRDGNGRVPLLCPAQLPLRSPSAARVLAVRARRAGVLELHEDGDAGDPYYRLPEAMAALPALQQPVITTLTPRAILSCLGLKLWDPARGEMLPFPRPGSHRL